jgi:tetratricopeptide (TPR) repeat protein
MTWSSALCIASAQASDEFPPPVDWAVVHTRTVRGIDQLYSLDFDSALQTFSQVRTMAAGDPRGYFFESMVWFWRYTMTNTDTDYEMFFGRSETAIEVCERLLETHPSDAKTMFYLGGLRGYRGLAHHMHGSYLRAAREGVEGYGLLEQAMSRDSALYDARMGFGLFKYLVAKVPRTLNWLLDLLGFEGDIEGGLTLLRQAATRGLYTRNEAAFFLSTFLFAEDRHEEAFSYLMPLIERYPENSVFRVMAAAWYLRMDRPDEALDNARRALEINRRKTFKYGEDIVYATLGAVSFARNEFKEARESYRNYARTVQTRGRIWNRSMFRLGVACEITGNRAAALEAYRSVRAPEDDLNSWDAYYVRRSRELLRTPLTQADILLIRADNRRGLNDTLGALGLYSQVLGLAGLSPDAEAEARYGVQQILLDGGHYAGAALAADSILALSPRKEAWIPPHALFMRGRALAHLGLHNAAQQAFEAALQYDGYDFQERLERRINEEIQRVKSGLPDAGGR